MELQFSKVLITFMFMLFMLLLIQNDVACSLPIGRRERQLQYKCLYDLNDRGGYSTTKCFKIRNTNNDNIEYDERDNDEIEDEEGADENNVKFNLGEKSEKEISKLIQSGTLIIVTNKEEEEEEEGSEILKPVEEVDERSKKRPWRKVQRILRRQLIKLPKRYLKKFIRKVGIRRQLRSSATRPTLLKLLPKNEMQVQEVGILMKETETAAATIAASTNGRFDESHVFVLNNHSQK